MIVLLYTKRKKERRSCFCLFTDGKQNKVLELDTITLRNHAPQSNMNSNRSFRQRGSSPMYEVVSPGSSPMHEVVSPKTNFRSPTSNENAFWNRSEMYLQIY